MAQENNVQNQNQNSTSELVVRREKLNNLYESGNNPFEITKYFILPWKSISILAPAPAF